MLIHEMSERECWAACLGEHLYGFATVGQKVEWMRANPLVCLELDDRAGHDVWTSVLAQGRYEELTDEPARAQALTAPPSPIPSPPSSTASASIA